MLLFGLVWKGVRAAVPCNYPIFTRMAMQLDKLNEGKRTKHILRVCSAKWLLE